MNKKKIIFFMLFSLAFQFTILSYYNFYISSIIKPIGVIIGATLIGAVLGTVGLVLFQVFYAKFLERADAYLDRYLNEEILESAEEH